jgi:predicted acyl esterase
MIRLLATLALSSATVYAADKISRPGEYSGYSEAAYDGYQLTSQYIAMRDGTRIAIDIIRPTTNGTVATKKLPVLWMHTPYNRRNYRDGLTAANYPGKALELVKFGYVVAVADFRGLFASFGHNDAYNRGEWRDAARFDVYDITEWLAKQPWSSGKIGMWGCSATGGSQMQALSVSPPSLKAVFPMSCEWDTYPFASGGGMAPPHGVPTQIMRGGSREERDKLAVPVDGDADRALLDAAIQEHAHNVETAGYTPFRDSVAENFADRWWLKSSPHTYLKDIDARIAVYAAANWDEGPTKYGAAFTFNNLKNPRKLIFGPATHCDWTTVRKETGFDIIVEEHRFFDYWLKGIDNGVMREAAVTYFTYNESPATTWRTAKQWPLPNEKRVDYFLGERTLSVAAAAAKPDARTVDYDINDQNFWDKALTFQTEPLAHDTRVTGHPVLRVWLASSAADADVVARVDDVAPDGTHRYYNIEGRLRASLRKLGPAPYENLGLPWHPFTEDSEALLKANEPVELQLDLLPISYRFLEGHRIRLAIVFADARATAKVTPAPTVEILHDAAHPSRLTLPVIPE